MKRIADGLTEGLEHDLKLSGEEYVAKIDQRKRIDVFLFYKECLVNVIRHAHATKIVTRLDIDNDVLRLCVCDDGIGLPGKSEGTVPSSLRRRSNILGARVTASRSELGGCCITMVLRWNRSLPIRLLDRVMAFRHLGPEH